jgi:hypothetical protein
MVRTIVAGVAAGIVLFVWGALAHMLLPIGNMGLKIAPDAQQQAALASLRANLGQEGWYTLPMPQEDQWRDEAAMQAFGQRMTNQPFAWVVFQPTGIDTYNGMGPMLGKQFLSVTLCGLIAAFVAAAVPGSRAKRIAVVAAFGLFAWLAVSVPYWNWYRFPAGLTAGAFLEQVIGWLLGGIAIALVLRPTARNV